MIAGTIVENFDLNIIITETFLGGSNEGFKVPVRVVNKLQSAQLRLYSNSPLIFLKS
jgi:hypothetical protein